jgi:prepilin-type N-terminal cleavage/methylation domain-containing protein
MRRNKGFTLIELMIVVAIIAIIAAIAIPSLLGAKKSANEASAISTCRTLSTVCEQYRNRTGTYPGLMDDLSGAGLIDNILGTTHQKSGYNFGSLGGLGDGNLAGTATTWVVYAEPQNASAGDRSFMISENGVLNWLNPTTGAWEPVQ